ncbi:MAG: urate hydroxylase PuuD, partial [Pseudomonadota bacterium]|nr:urate hydroxylase PuuD [Pseudomonadota bacterium]
TYTHKYNWIVLLLIMLGGAAIRQFFVVRHRFKLGNARNPLPYALFGIVVLGLTIVWMKPEPVAAPAPSAAAAPVSYAEVQKVLEQRCYMCHGAAVQMKNVRLDSPDQVAAHAQAVYQQVVVTKIMPMNNATGMTDAERALVGKWFNGGAKTN